MFAKTTNSWAGEKGDPKNVHGVDGGAHLASIERTLGGFASADPAISKSSSDIFRLKPPHEFRGLPRLMYSPIQRDILFIFLRLQHIEEFVL